MAFARGKIGGSASFGRERPRRRTKNMKMTLGIGSLILALNIAATANATPVNGSFDTGDFSGWTVSIPTNFSSLGPLVAAGSAVVVSSWQGYGMTSPILPANGNYLAAVGSAANAWYPSDQIYNISLSQSISLNLGDTLSGLSSFYNGDWLSQDSASVRIYDSQGNLISTPWYELSGEAPLGTPTVPYDTASPWTSWSWQAPADGTYTLVLEVTTGGDDNYASYGLFDDIGVNASPNDLTSVPEPSTTALFAIASLCLVALRRGFKKQDACS
jgi:hypothetical protein